MPVKLLPVISSGTLTLTNLLLLLVMFSALECWYSWQRNRTNCGYLYIA